jgi:hypothetical protein
MAGVGLTHGGFYSYFKSKSDLYAGLSCKRRYHIRQHLPTFEDLSVFNQRGVAKGGVISWKGIPDAAPQVGNLRRQSRGPACGMPARLNKTVPTTAKWECQEKMLPPAPLGDAGALLDLYTRGKASGVDGSSPESGDRFQTTRT